MENRTLTDHEILEAAEDARGRAAELDGPRASGASYDDETGRVLVELTDGCVFGFPARLAQGLRGASPQELREVEVVLGGRALRWERLDADLLVSGVVRGIFGSRRWMEDVARELGARGGRVRSEAKAAAARRNGRKGGRPRR